MKKIIRTIMISATIAILTACSGRNVPTETAASSEVSSENVVTSSELASENASDDTEGSEPSDTKTDSATEQTAQTEADTAAGEKTYTADELKDAIKSRPEVLPMLIYKRELHRPI